MEKNRIDSFCEKFRQIMLPLKSLSSKAFSTKPGMIGLAAVLVLVLTVTLTTCSRKEPMSELADATTEAQMEVTASVPWKWV